MIPQTKERPRQGRAYGSGQRIFYTPPKTRKFEKAVADEVQEQMRLHGWMPFPKELPLHAHVRFTFGVKDTKKWQRFKTSRIDLDNAIKGIFDSLNGIVYPDDAQIVIITALKGYGRLDQIDIELRELSVDGFSSAFSEPVKNGE